MICDFTQIQGGPQISFLVNLWVSLNLWEKTEFTKGDDARHNEVSSEAEIHPKGMLGIILASKTLFAWLRHPLRLGKPIFSHFVEDGAHLVV